MHKAVDRPKRVVLSHIRHSSHGALTYDLAMPNNTNPDNDKKPSPAAVTQDNAVVSAFARPADEAPLILRFAREDAVPIVEGILFQEAPRLRPSTGTRIIPHSRRNRRKGGCAVRISNADVMQLVRVSSVSGSVASAMSRSATSLGKKPPGAFPLAETRRRIRTPGFSRSGPRTPVCEAREIAVTGCTLFRRPQSVSLPRPIPAPAIMRNVFTDSYCEDRLRQWAGKEEELLECGPRGKRQRR